jgi:hypothetical protein
VIPARVAAWAAFVLAALASCPAAAAHGGGVPGYTSSVEKVTPAIAGVTVSVLDGDDRLLLVNGSGRELVILGYDGEPYLRFAPKGGVYRNARSPATYRNDDRYGAVELPAQPNPRAAPAWERVAAGRRFEWHDHRIHWMSEIPPPQVRADPDRAHRIFEWEVPGTADGRPFTIEGALDWKPPSSGSPPWLYLALPLCALVLASSALARLRRRRVGGRAR